MALISLAGSGFLWKNTLVFLLYNSGPANAIVGLSLVSDRRQSRVAPASIFSSRSSDSKQRWETPMPVFSNSESDREPLTLLPQWRTTPSINRSPIYSAIGFRQVSTDPTLCYSPQATAVSSGRTFCNLHLIHQSDCENKSRSSITGTRDQSHKESHRCLCHWEKEPPLSLFRFFWQNLPCVLPIVIITITSINRSTLISS